MFYLRAGEMTITLQDVVVFLRIRIDGPPVRQTDNKNWVVKYERLLGSEPPLTAMRGGTLKLKWLRQHFSVDSLIDV